MSVQLENGPAGGVPEAPADFGKYRLVRRIGRGGMAEVFLARPRGQRRLLAIKCMRQSVAGRPAFIEMFIREGKLAVQLNHEAIVKTYEIGRIQGVPFICMEYISGVDLSQIIPRIHSHYLRRLPVPHAVHIALQVCEGLAHAHGLQDAEGRPLRLVNRDVNPSNIRVAYDGRVKLLDFGIAKAATALSSEIGAIKGKIGHMSPEQVRGLPLDCRSDIFSVGVTLHEMLTGERLFKGSSDFQTMDRVRRAEVAPPSDGNPRVPAELDAIVLRMLCREPEQRYQSGAEVVGDLRAVLAGYRFVPTEMSTLVQNLFREEWEREQRAISETLAGDAGDVGAEADAGDDYGEFLEVIDDDVDLMRPGVKRVARKAPWWMYGLLVAAVLLVGMALLLVLRS